MASVWVMNPIQYFNFIDNPGMIEEVLETGECPICVLNHHSVLLGDLEIGHDEPFIIQQCPKCCAVFFLDSIDE